MDEIRMTIAMRAAYAIRHARGKDKKREAVHEWRAAMQNALKTVPTKPGRKTLAGNEERM